MERLREPEVGEGCSEHGRTIALRAHSSSGYLHESKVPAWMGKRHSSPLPWLRSYGHLVAAKGFCFL